MIVFETDLFDSRAGNNTRASWVSLIPFSSHSPVEEMVIKKP